MRLFIPWILGLATSLLLYASFPKLDQGWMSLFALVPWLIVIYSRRRLRLKIGVTAATFLVFFGLSLEWMRFVTWLAFVPLVVYLTVYPVIFCLFMDALGSERLVRSPTGRLWLPALTAPVVWAALEWGRGNFLTGLPWLLLGHALHQSKIAQAADIIGSYGLSFLVAAVNSALAFLIVSALRLRDGSEQSETEMQGIQIPARTSSLVWERIYLGVCLVLVVCCWVYGALRLREEVQGVEFRVGVVQANVDKRVRQNSTRAASLLDVHLGLSRKLDSCDIIVWPETSVPVLIENRPEMMGKLSALAKERKAYLLVGAIGRKNLDNYNSTFLISPSGEFLSRYDKVHLVPFGEFIPLPRVFGSIVRGRVYYKKSFKAGSETVVFKAGGVPLSTLICYEIIFPDLVGRAVGEGARLLVNMTSEGWFGEGAEMEQHLAIARMNAIEYRVPVVRAANTGISAYIDYMGRIIRSPNLVEETAGVDVFVVQVPHW